MEPRASFGSFTIRGRRANEPAKHYRTRLMADGKFVAGWLAVKVSEVDHRGLAKRIVAVVLDRPSRGSAVCPRRAPGPRWQGRARRGVRSRPLSPTMLLAPANEAAYLARTTGRYET